MRKIIILILVSLIIFSFANIQKISSQGLEGAEEQLENLEQKADVINEFTEADKWEYLSKEWNTILLKNPKISAIDSFLKKINFMFVLFFGENYSISLTLLFVIIFWIFFILNFNKIFTNYSFLSLGISLSLSFLITIIMAHLHILRFFSELVFKLIFYKEGIWGWIWFIIFLIILSGISIVVKYFGAINVRKREQMKKAMAEIDRDVLHEETKFLKKIGEGLSK